MKAPLARASFTSARTLGTGAQRGRRCSVQVWLVKSITSRAVSLATMVAGLSAGGGGKLGGRPFLDHGLRLRPGASMANDGKRRHHGGQKFPHPRHLRSSRG